MPQVDLNSDNKTWMGRHVEMKKWPTHSAQTRMKHGVPADAQPWAPSVGLLGVTRTPRVLDVIDTCIVVVCLRRPDMPRKQLSQGMWINVSQGVQRLPYMWQVPTPATSTYAYSVEKDRLLSARVTMKLIGWPDNFLEHDVLERDFRYLSGNGCSLPIAAMHTCIVYSNPWAPWNSTSN